MDARYYESGLPEFVTVVRMRHRVEAVGQSDHVLCRIHFDHPLLDLDSTRRAECPPRQSRGTFGGLRGFFLVGAISGALPLQGSDKIRPLMAETSEEMSNSGPDRETDGGLA